MRPTPQHQPARMRGETRRHAGFTLLEMIVAMIVIVSAMLVVVQAMARVQDTWVTTHAKVREAEDARAGVETLSRTLSRATLNLQWSLGDVDEPKFLIPRSDLHFVSGPASELLSPRGYTTGHAVFFQAPNGYAGTDDRTTTTTSDKAEYETLPDVLSAWGYFVEFGEDPAKLPSFIAGTRRTQGLASKRYRFRLMEFRQPAHELTLFQMMGGDSPAAKISSLSTQSDLYKWFRDPIAEPAQSDERRCAVIADNILALVILPLQRGDQAGGVTTGQSDPDPTADCIHDSRRFQWDPASTKSAQSRHRLPAALQMTLIVLDERDWSKMNDEEAIRAGGDLRSQVSQKFQKPASFAAEMGSLTGELNRRKMRHRVITTTLKLPGDGWTTDLDAP